MKFISTSTNILIKWLKNKILKNNSGIFNIVILEKVKFSDYEHPTKASYVGKPH